MHSSVYPLSYHAWQSSLAVIAALRVEVECRYTVA